MRELVAKELTILQAREHWEEAERYLRRAVYGSDPDGYMRNVQAKVFSGLHTLWRVEDEAGDAAAYAVTTIYTPDGVDNIAQIYLTTADDLDEIIEQVDYFTSWAIRHGLATIEVIGRKGWERILRPMGFRHEYTSLIKRVPKELH